MSGASYQEKKIRTWHDNDPLELRQLLTELPTACCTTVDEFLVYVEESLNLLPVRTDFFGSARWRALKRKTEIQKQRAYHRLCLRITDGDPETIVAFGNALFSPSFGKGNPSSPHNKLCRMLHLYCRHVIGVGEYRTSITCSLDDSYLAPGRFWRCKAVCPNPNCRVQWNRDVNAARNIRAIFIHMMRNNGAKPAAFQYQGGAYVQAIPNDPFGY